MSGVPPPNPELAELAQVLGVDNVRLLVRTFLQEYPELLRQLRDGDRATRQRMVHSLKSNTRVLGGTDVSDRMAAAERQLATPTEPDLAAQDIAALIAAVEGMVTPLRAFAEGSGGSDSER